MIPYTTLDSIIAQMPERTGHTLLDENQGCVKGCRMGVSLYRNTEYHMPQKHDDQEGFFVLDGKGYEMCIRDRIHTVQRGLLCYQDQLPYALVRQLCGFF